MAEFIALINNILRYAKKIAPWNNEK